MRVKKIMLRYVKNKKGFSLIELMVTLALLSMITIGLVTFFGGGIRSWITGNSQLRSQREARMAMDMMVKEMRSGESATLNSNQSITINIPPLGENDDYIVTFSWSGNNGDPLQRTVNGTSNDSPLTTLTISNLSFDKNGNRIDIILEMNLDDDEKPDITLETNVFLRNS